MAHEQVRHHRHLYRALIFHMLCRQTPNTHSSYQPLQFPCLCHARVLWTFERIGEYRIWLLCIRVGVMARQVAIKTSELFRNCEMRTFVLSRLDTSGIKSVPDGTWFKPGDI